MYNLKPCPFCGTKNPSVWQISRTKGWAVKCVDGCSVVIDGYIGENGAVKAWNARADGASFDRLTSDVILLDGKHYRAMTDEECAEFIWDTKEGGAK